MGEDFEMIDVVSSTILSIGYNESLQTLRIQFHNGILYEYYNLPLVEFEQFMNSPSKGEYLSHNLRGKYPYNKIG